MGYFFSPYRIAEMAMELEIKGIKFYEYLASCNSDDKTKKVFLFLSNQEVAHYRTFQEIAAAMRQKNSEHEYSIDVSRLLQEAIDDLNNMVFSLESLATDSIDMNKCFEIAINTEKKSVLAYEEIQNSFTKEFQGVLSKILDEEREHLKMLVNVKKKLRL
jgi:rubrerythrin